MVSAVMLPNTAVIVNRDKKCGARDKGGRAHLPFISYWGGEGEKCRAHIRRQVT